MSMIKSEKRKWMSMTDLLKGAIKIYFISFRFALYFRMILAMTQKDAQLFSVT